MIANMTGKETTTLFAVRHGETEWNLVGKQQGHLDSPLTELLVVTHGGVLNSLFYHAVGLAITEPRRFSLFNAAINSFTASGEVWRLDTWGETSHLKGMRTLDGY